VPNGLPIMRPPSPFGAGFTDLRTDKSFATP
jgi:hypothetical protein